jgi:hypothetical protein
LVWFKVFVGCLGWSIPPPKATRTAKKEYTGTKKQTAAKTKNKRRTKDSNQPPSSARARPLMIHTALAGSAVSAPKTAITSGVGAALIEAVPMSVPS